MTLPPLAPPYLPYARALEAYIDAKDNTRPQRMADAFRADAELTVSLATSAIAFPARTVGIDAITRTLVTDFGATYTQCRTYYVCDSLTLSDGAIDPLPWLVVMREPAASALRVGHGVYRWNFDHTVAVSHFHIHIARMDVVPDADGALIHALQGNLSYPWLTPAELETRFLEHMRREPRLAFAKTFSRPVEAPLREHGIPGNLTAT